MAFSDARSAPVNSIAMAAGAMVMAMMAATMITAALAALAMLVSTWTLRVSLGL